MGYARVQADVSHVAAFLDCLSTSYEDIEDIKALCAATATRSPMSLDMTRRRAFHQMPPHAQACAWSPELCHPTILIVAPEPIHDRAASTKYLCNKVRTQQLV